MLHAIDKKDIKLFINRKLHYSMIWIVAHWEMFLAGLGILATPIAYVFGGKAKQNVSLKKDNADAVSSMQQVYDGFLIDYKARMGDVMQELLEMRGANRELQNKFNEIHLQYAKEVETSQNWEKLHRELKHQYEDLERKYTTLQADHVKLREEVKDLTKHD